MSKKLLKANKPFLIRVGNHPVLYFTMGFLETTIAIILAQIPTYFIQRYFFKSIMDKHLDTLENRIKSKVNVKGTINQWGNQIGEFAKRETTFS